MWLVYVCVYICVCRCITCRWYFIRSLFSARSHRSACGLLLLGWVLFKCHSDDLFLCVRTAGDFRPIAVPELYFGGVTGGATASISHVVSINYQETVNGEQSRASEHCSPVTAYPNSRARNVHVTFCPLSVPFLFFSFLLLFLSCVRGSGLCVIQFDSNNFNQDCSYIVQSEYIRSSFTWKLFLSTHCVGFSNNRGAIYWRATKDFLSIVSSILFIFPYRQYFLSPV